MKKNALLILSILSIAFLYFYFSLNKNSSKDVLNIYSARKEKFISDIIAKFTQDTGIEVNILIDKSPKLIAKINSEGNISPADLFITSDIFSAQYAKELNLLTPIDNKIINDAIINNFKDDENYWFGISVRNRLIFYNNKIYQKPPLKNYEDLALPKFNSKILVRSSANPYNQALIAQILYHNQNGEKIVKDIANNLARDPNGGDTDQLRALARGEGAIAIANNYYYLRLVNSSDVIDSNYAKNISVIYPNEDNYGANINLSTISVIKNSKNQKLATKFIQYMLSDDIQEYFVRNNHEKSVLKKKQANNNFDTNNNIKKYYSYSQKAIDITRNTKWE